MQKQKPLVVYHANCLDGFGAAWCFYKHFGDGAEYVAMDYKDPLSETLFQNREIFMVDLCLNMDKMLRVCELSNEYVIVLDHHESQERIFRELESKRLISGKFDLTKSGAGLAWDWLYGDKLPHLIACTEDRDLWRFNIPGSKALMTYMGSLHFDFMTWSTMAHVAETLDGRKELEARGTAILASQAKIIQSMLRNNVVMKCISGHVVPTLNIPYAFASDAGHELAKGNRFAATYIDETEGRRYSLRSDKKLGLNVADIAKVYGGGGHRNAAGFFVPWTRVRELEDEFYVPQLIESVLGEK